MRSLHFPLIKPRTNRPILAERRLATAILVQSLHDMMGGSRTKPKDTIDAIEWISSETYYIGSFSWVCESLDFIEELTRERLFSMSTQELRKLVNSIKHKIHR